MSSIDEIVIDEKFRSRIPMNDPFRRRAAEIVIDWAKANLMGGAQ